MHVNVSSIKRLSWCYHMGIRKYYGVRRNLNKHVQCNLVSSYIWSCQTCYEVWVVWVGVYHNLLCKEYEHLKCLTTRSGVGCAISLITSRILHWWDHHHYHIENSDVARLHIAGSLVDHLRLAYTIYINTPS